MLIVVLFQDGDMLSGLFVSVFFATILFLAKGAAKDAWDEKENNQEKHFEHKEKNPL